MALQDDSDYTVENRLPKVKGAARYHEVIWGMDKE